MTARKNEERAGEGKNEEERKRGCCMQSSRGPQHHSYSSLLLRPDETLVIWLSYLFSEDYSNFAFFSLLLPSYQFVANNPPLSRL